MTEKPLLKEFQWYLANQDKLVKLYNGKILVIKEQRVIGADTSEAKAIKAAMKEHKLGTFLIQRCSPGNKDYTVIIHTPGLVHFD